MNTKNEVITDTKTKRKGIKRIDLSGFLTALFIFIALLGFVIFIFGKTDLSRGYDDWDMLSLYVVILSFSGGLVMNTEKSGYLATFTDLRKDPGYKITISFMIFVITGLLILNTTHGEVRGLGGLYFLAIVGCICGFSLAFLVVGFVVNFKRLGIPKR